MKIIINKLVQLRMKAMNKKLIILNILIMKMKNIKLLINNNNNKI